MLKLIHGDCRDVASTLEDCSVDCVITSPPYAQQRSKLYGGIEEAEYPSWTVQWMEAVRPKLKPQGSVAVVIRPHVEAGQISDYMLRTRLAVRESGWFETEEIIWIKTDSPPCGHTNRPRRAWESIHWFSLSRDPYCDPKAIGQHSKRIGMQSKKGHGSYISGISDVREGISRGCDFVSVGVSSSDRSDGNTHPAQYPVELCHYLVKLLCPSGGTVLDPFLGSGTTAEAALQLGRNCIGIERDETYFNFARSRLAEISLHQAVFRRYFQT